MPFREVIYYGQPGNLYPWDVRFRHDDRAWCDPRPDGRVRLRLQTEPGFREATIAYNDGLPKAQPMTLVGESHRFQFWEGIIRPASRQFRYYLALKHHDGFPVYVGPNGIISAVERPFELDLDQVAPVQTPEWAHGAVMYQIFPERFANGDPNLDPEDAVPWGSPPESFHFQGGDLLGIIERLDYLQDLGVEVLYLNPVFASPSNHKYDTVDYYQVDPAFGGNRALRELVRELHKRDMRIILDASFNHCSPRFHGFRDVQEKGAASPYWAWFTIYDYPLNVKVRPHLVPEEDRHWSQRLEFWIQRFQETTGIPVYRVTDDDGPLVEPSYATWFSAMNMPKLNLSNPETRAYFLDVTGYWLREFDTDGWRMDVVPHIVPDFWDDFRRAAKRAKPDAYLLAEVWGDCGYWTQGSRFDATMNYTFRQLCLDYFATTKLSTADFLDRYLHLTHMYSKDVTDANLNLLSSHDTPRFLRFAGEEIQRLQLATLFQMTTPGAPSVYYGDEIGMTGGPDPDCRRAFPWDQPETWDRETLLQVKALAHLRRSCPALRLGGWRLVWQQAEGLAFVREWGEQRVLVVMTRQSAILDQVLPVESGQPQHLWGRGKWHHHAGEHEGAGIVVESLDAWSGLIIEL